MEKRNYHHGDLHAALIAAGLALLKERDADDLSLREVARRVGVSATAVYRHFPDKDALLSALADEGLKQLGAAQHAAFDAKGGGVAGFSATGATYVRFALENPALFRLIFTNPDAQAHGAHDQPDDAMTFLRENATALAPPGSNPRVVALQAWSVAHGLAMLMLDGHVEGDDALIEAVLDTHAMEVGLGEGRADAAADMKRK